MRSSRLFCGLGVLAGLAVWSPSAISVPVPATPGTGVSVVTLNLARETDLDRILADFRRNPALAAADVWLLQEVMHPDGGAESVAHHLAARMGVHVTSSPAYPGVSGDGLAILSRYPLSDSFPISTCAG
jgi:hypothetical protein